MQTYVTSKIGPPVPMAAYQRRVAEFANRHGDLWVKKYPFEDPLFPKRSGADYAGCGALWHVDNSTVPGERAQQMFNKVCKQK